MGHPSCQMLSILAIMISPWAKDCTEILSKEILRNMTSQEETIPYELDETVIPSWEILTRISTHGRLDETCHPR